MAGKQFSQAMVARKLEAKGWSQMKIAVAFDVHVSHVNRMLASGAEPGISYERFKQLAENLGISLGELDRMGTDPDWFPPQWEGGLPALPPRDGQGFPAANGRILAAVR